MVAELISWARGNVGRLSEWIGLSLALWIGSLVVTALAVRYYLIWLPADFFAKEHVPFHAWRSAHPLMWALLVLKNIAGLVLAAAGLVMLVTPGPGWLALLIGLALVDVPGKRALERLILKRPVISNLVNRIRAKAGQPPLVLEQQ